MCILMCLIVDISVSMSFCLLDFSIILKHFININCMFALRLSVDIIVLDLLWN